MIDYLKTKLKEKPEYLPKTEQNKNKQRQQQQQQKNKQTVFGILSGKTKDHYSMRNHIQNSDRK